MQLASGILSIAAVKMSEAIKRITVQRGEDPREFVLFAYGGGGPLHAAELARELAIPMVVIPPEAGNFSAIGMLLADIRRDESRTFLRRLAPEAMPDIATAFRSMEESLRTSIQGDFGAVPIEWERSVEMRFFGQYHTVRVPMVDDFEGLRSRFLTLYRERYGHAMERAPTECVSLHCAIRARTDRPDIRGLAGELPASPPPESGIRRRPVLFPNATAPVQAKVFDRAALPVGFGSDGPVVIEEYGSTTLVAPGDRFEIGLLGEIRISIQPEGVRDR